MYTFIFSCASAQYENATYCGWNYVGSGIQYQLLAGPCFIVVFTITGILLGVIGDVYNRFAFSIQIFSHPLLKFASCVICFRETLNFQLHSVGIFAYTVVSFSFLDVYVKTYFIDFYTET